MGYKFKGTAVDYFSTLTDDMIKEVFENHGFDTGVNELPSIKKNEAVLVEVKSSKSTDFEFQKTSKVQSLSAYRQIKEKTHTKEVNFIQYNYHEEYAIHLNLFEELKIEEEKELGVGI
ncbi:hypothetical protein [Planococcus soli]|uniref:hypothetical protein n=1 Tax=Planococcus soli TaxID=2666072 RepID=UPI00115CD341|nr:hypothetical protein [Planococcus soli]